MDFPAIPVVGSATGIRSVLTGVFAVKALIARFAMSINSKEECRFRVAKAWHRFRVAKAMPC